MIEANNKRDIFVLCIAFGAGFHVLHWLVGTGLIVWLSPNGRSLLPDFVRDLPPAVTWGIVRGMFWAAFALLLIRRKPIRRAARFLVLVVTPIVIMTSITLVIWTDSNTPLLVIRCLGALPTVAVILTFVYAKMALPNIAYTADQCPHCGQSMAQHCRSCGYNLTGNESGICPECGTEVRA